MALLPISCNGISFPFHYRNSLNLNKSQILRYVIRYATHVPFHSYEIGIAKIAVNINVSSYTEAVAMIFVHWWLEKLLLGFYLRMIIALNHFVRLRICYQKIAAYCLGWLFLREITKETHLVHYVLGIIYIYQFDNVLLTVTGTVPSCWTPREF